MTNRTSILALAALAAASISTLVPTSASAWGLHTSGGYGGHNVGGVYRPMGGVNHGGFGYGSVRPAWYPHQVSRPWFPSRWTVARPYWRPSYQVGPAYFPARPAYVPSYPVAPATYVPSYPAAQPAAAPCDDEQIQPTYVPPRRPVSYVPAPMPQQMPVMPAAQATPDCETLPVSRTAQVQYR